MSIVYFSIRDKNKKRICGEDRRQFKMRTFITCLLLVGFVCIVATNENSAMAANALGASKDKKPAVRGEDVAKEGGRLKGVGEKKGLIAGETRVLHFPKDRSIGRLKIQDIGINESLFQSIHKSGDKWEYFGEAIGDVVVPEDKQLKLIVSKAGVQDLSPLSTLGWNDLHTLDLKSTGADDTCMRHLDGLTGLKVLNLRGTKITDVGLQVIKGLKSLRHLHLSSEITDAGLVYLSGLKSLEKLSLLSTKITDAGLADVAKVTSLRDLYLGGTNITDAGLAHLAKLTSLSYLNLQNTHVSDAGLAHLKNTISLKSLNVGNTNITDKGLAYLSNLTLLESLILFKTNITDKGLAYLKAMPLLKELNLEYTQVTDNGLWHLKDVKSLESLKLPNHTLSDRGMTYLAQLPKLKHLIIRTTKQICTDEGLRHLSSLNLLEELDIGGPGVTDEGLSHIAKLTNLKVLSLQNCPITNDGLAKLTTLKSLQKLTLHNGRGDRNMEVTGAGLAYFRQLPLIYLWLWQIKLDESRLTQIGGLTQLEELQIRQMPLCDEDLANLRTLSSLKRLVFDSETVSDGGIAHLAGLTSMEDLAPSVPMTDVGLSYLANMNRLERLQVNGDFTDKGLGHLGRLKALRTLRITSGNDFSPSNLERLQKELPLLQTFGVIKSREIKIPPKIGVAAPQFNLKTLDGKETVLEDYRGKVVVLYFWATWCRPCVAGTPKLRKFYADMKASFGDDFEMISLSMDDNEQLVCVHVKKYGLIWPQARIGLNSKISSDYGVNDTAPKSFLIGPDGKILLTPESPQVDTESFIEKVLKNRKI